MQGLAGCRPNIFAPCRREINKHEGIAVRSAHALPRVLAVGDSRRRSRRCVAARSCRAGSADRSAVVPSSVPSSPPRHSPPQPLSPPPAHPPPPLPPTTPPRHFPLRVESIVWRGNTTPRSLERRLERARRRQPVNLVDPVDRACDHALMCPRRRRARGPVPHVSPHVVQWIPSPAPSRRGIGYGWSILVSHQLGGGRYTISFASHAEPSPLSSLSEGVAPRAK